MSPKRQTLTGLGLILFSIWAGAWAMHALPPDWRQLPTFGTFVFLSGVGWFLAMTGAMDWLQANRKKP